MTYSIKNQAAINNGNELNLVVLKALASDNYEVAKIAAEKRDGFYAEGYGISVAELKGEKARADADVYRAAFANGRR